jgi:hypothetical protein
MVFNATFNNISVISWRKPEKNTDLSKSPRPDRGFEPTTPVVIGTDCIGSSKSNYHTITATTAAVYYEYKSCSAILNLLQIFWNMLPVSLDCPFWIAPSVFPTVYLSCNSCTLCCQVSLDCPFLIAVR